MNRIMHMGVRIARLMVVMLMVAGTALFTIGISPGSVLAAEVRNGDDADIAAGETIAEDVYLFGEDVVIDGTALFDVTVVAETLVINGTIEGNLNAIAKKITITGSIGRSARVAAQNTDISGTVGGDLLLATGELILEQNARIAGDLLMAGGYLTLNGVVAGELRTETFDDETDGLRLTPGTPAAAIDTTTSALTVTGTVTSAAASNSLTQIAGAGATPTGIADVGTQVGGVVVTGSPVGGSVRATVTSQLDRVENQVDGVVHDLRSLMTAISILSALFTAIVVVLLMPRGVVAAADAIRTRPLRTLVNGAVGWIVVPALAGFLLVTLIGAPVALVIFAALFIIAYLGQVFLGLAIGRLILPRGWRSGGRGFNLLGVVIGVAILQGLRLIPVTEIDALVQVISVVLALGAVWIGSRRRAELENLALRG